MMPRNVKWFAWTWVISYLLAFPEIFLLPRPHVNAAKLTWSGEVKISIALILLLMAIFLPIFRLAVWGQRNWARWVLFVTFILSLPLLFADRRMLQPGHLPLTAYAFAGTLLQAVGFYWLFTGDAQPWFGAKNSK